MSVAGRAAATMPAPSHLRCMTCGRHKDLKRNDVAANLRTGWPKCCTYTMRLFTENDADTDPWKGSEQGIDAKTLAELEDLDVGLDVYSATCRPGSWEYHRAEAAELRGVLRARGYTPETDAEASWRLWWRRSTS